jgi:pimeloyl-ACP methyl ester carboxylesterase
MNDFIEALGGAGDMDEDVRRWTLANDFAALAAAWKQAMAEGDLSGNLAKWSVPCLIYAGTEDAAFFADAQRAASVIPGARFLALQGLDHLAPHANVEEVLPHIEALIDA